MREISIALLAALLMLAACSAPQTQEPTETLSEQEVISAAQEWVVQAPTYSYDGIDIELIDYRQETQEFPAHTVIFNFTTESAGYGDRSDQATAQVITEHQIRLLLVNGEVREAIIDNEWDEINQEMMFG